MAGSTFPGRRPGLSNHCPFGAQGCRAVVVKSIGKLVLLPPCPLLGKEEVCAGAVYSPDSSGMPSTSASQAAAEASAGMRHSLRGESAPPEPTFGPSGMQSRLN